MTARDRWAHVAVIFMLIGWMVGGLTVTAHGIADAKCVSRAEARATVKGETRHHLRVRVAPDWIELWHQPGVRDYVGCDRDTQVMRVQYAVPGDTLTASSRVFRAWWGVCVVPTECVWERVV